MSLLNADTNLELFDKNQVIAFKGTVEDIPGLQGIMVALKGYQSGARRFADDNGILAIDITELPSLGMLMGARIEAVALPDDKTAGEPFWALYAVEGQKATGALYGREIEGRVHLLLFFSKVQASIFLSKIPQPTRDKFSVRGMTQHGLRFFLLMTHAANKGMCVADPFSDQVGAVIPCDQRALARDYYYGSTPITEKDWSVSFSDSSRRG